MFRCSHFIILNTLFNQNKVSKKNDVIKAIYNVIFLGKIKKLLQKFKQRTAILALRSVRTRAAKRRIAACAVPNVFRIFHVLAEKTFHKDSFFKNNGYQHHYPHKTVQNKRKKTKK